MKRLVAVLSLCAALAAHAGLPRCAEVLVRALDADAGWTMERSVPGLAAPLRSTGRVSCCAGSGIVWRVDHPFFSEVRMLRDEMAFADDDGVRRKALRDLPQYDRIRKQTDAFLAGDAHAFDGAFDLRASDSTNGWSLVLVPTLGALKRLFVRVELVGGEKFEGVTLATPDGGETRIRFTHKAQGAHALWKEAP